MWTFTLKLPIKKGYHPIILGVKPIFKGILRVQGSIYCRFHRHCFGSIRRNGSETLSESFGHRLSDLCLHGNDRFPPLDPPKKTWCSEGMRNGMNQAESEPDSLKLAKLDGLNQGSFQFSGTLHLSHQPNQTKTTTKKQKNSAFNN